MTATSTPAAAVMLPPAVIESSAGPRVLGVDLSLASTGIAGGTWVETIRGSVPTNATRQDEWARLRTIRGTLARYLDVAELVVIEAMIPSSFPGVRERAFLYWWTVGRCIQREIPFAEVQPATLKVYGTGSGRASKEDMVQQAQRRRPDLTFKGNDAADAIFLAMMGLDSLGQPPVVMPATHRRALDSVAWPELPR